MYSFHIRHPTHEFLCDLSLTPANNRALFFLKSMQEGFNSQKWFRHHISKYCW